MHDELPLVRQALDAGASGYLTKNSAPEVLIEAVQRVLAGHAYIEQPLATQLACLSQQSTSDPRLQRMTQRELEIFTMLAKGHPGAGDCRAVVYQCQDRVQPPDLAQEQVAGQLACRAGASGD